MVQGKRNEAIKRLTEGRVNVLVATDVAARGIDIPDVSHVFNFDMPRSGDTYLHRIGRTARAGRKGTAISLVEAHDHLLLGKVGVTLKSRLKLALLMSYARKRVRQARSRPASHRRKYWQNAPRRKS